MSWKAEVIADSTGKWCSNSLRFATEAEARVYSDDLMFRWTSVVERRVTETPDEPVTHAWIVRRAVRLNREGFAFPTVLDGGTDPKEET